MFLFRLRLRFSLPSIHSYHPSPHVRRQWYVRIKHRRNNATSNSGIHTNSLIHGELDNVMLSLTHSFCPWEQKAIIIIKQSSFLTVDVVVTCNMHNVDCAYIFSMFFHWITPLLMDYPSSLLGCYHFGWAWKNVLKSTCPVGQ